MSEVRDLQLPGSDESDAKKRQKLQHRLILSNRETGGRTKAGKEAIFYSIPPEIKPATARTLHDDKATEPQQHDDTRANEANTNSRSVRHTSECRCGKRREKGERTGHIW